jgi:exopolyphosphatase/guanosine-5'-triphosphate,3'-diphosphate pyrophosphatase
MRIAIIDLGTNSVRFDVHQIGPGRGIRRLHRDKLMIRLGQGVFTDGKLDSNAIRRTTQAFLGFRRIAKDLHVEKIVAFGTSALREAYDSEKFLARIYARTEIDVRVISGDEEAELIALGILSQESQARGKFALVDIGGGSTEISLCQGSRVLHASSFPSGLGFLGKDSKRNELGLFVTGNDPDVDLGSSIDSSEEFF